MFSYLYFSYVIYHFNFEVFIYIQMYLKLVDKKLDIIEMAVYGGYNLAW